MQSNWQAFHEVMSEEDFFGKSFKNYRGSACLLICTTQKHFDWFFCCKSLQDMSGWKLYFCWMVQYLQLKPQPKFTSPSTFEKN